MIKAYIDPGTGSMLFGILIGIFGAAGFLISNGIAKLKFILTGGKAKSELGKEIPLVIFSDDKRYWKNFEPICRELDKRSFDVTYMTASEDDPVLQNPYKHIHGVFIGAGNKAFAKLNFINATILFSTTPGLDVYQWKRSKKAKCYIHVPHAANDITLYRMFGLDYYDVVMLSGDYQIAQLEQLEKLRNSPKKELVKIGIPYMDDMLTRYKNDKEVVNNATKTVLLAPSWGKSGILSRFGSKIISELIKTGYDIIVRPHPQSVKSEKDLLNRLTNEFKDANNLTWNYDTDNYDVLKKSDIMISDFSGVVFEFSLVYDKPVIYAIEGIDKSPYDAWWLDEELWTFSALPRLGTELTEDNIANISAVIDDCLNNPKFTENRNAIKEETWANIGHGAEIAADFLINKYNALTKKEEN